MVRHVSASLCWLNTSTAQQLPELIGNGLLFPLSCPLKCRHAKDDVPDLIRQLLGRRIIGGGIARALAGADLLGIVQGDA